MSQRLELDNLQFAQQRSVLRGELGLSALSRLVDVVESGADGCVRYLLQGSIGDRNEPVLHLRLECDLVLRCQRCLQPLKYRLEIDQAFELRESIDDEELMQEDLEDDLRDYLEVSRSMDLLSLIEDEVLLALPTVPRHEVCAMPEQRQDPEAASPFGVLLKIKGQSGKTH